MTENNIHPEIIDKIRAIVSQQRFRRPSQQTCPICREPMDNQNEIRIVPDCGHAFHKNCVDPWIAQRHKCPYCKQPVSDKPRKLS